MMDDDLISRWEAIKILWKALYRYEDVQEKKFLESEELDVGDWFLHRTFVQDMNDIDRQAILSLPPAEPSIIRCKDCKHRPSGTGVNHDLEFPHNDYKCPCRCEDYWYSWKPADNWYCANGERIEREGESNENQD